MTPRDIAILILSAIIVFGFLGGVIVAWMVFPPAEQSNMLSSLTGALGAGYLQVILVLQAEEPI